MVIKMTNNFIKTQDENTAIELRKTLKELPKEGSFFVFINDRKQIFSKNDKVIFSDKLCI